MKWPVLASLPRGVDDSAPRPGLGTRSTVAVFGLDLAASTLMKRPLPALLPRRDDCPFAIVDPPVVGCGWTTTTVHMYSARFKVVSVTRAQELEGDRAYACASLGTGSAAPGAKPDDQRFSEVPRVFAATSKAIGHGNRSEVA